MMEEIVRKDFEKTLNSIKSPDEAADAVNNIGKLIRSNQTYYGLNTSMARYFKNSKQMKILQACLRNWV